MERLNKKLIVFTSLFIIIQPIIDLITGIAIHNGINLTIGIIVRILFLGVISLLALTVYKKKKLLIPYSLIALYFIFYLIFNSFNLINIQSLFRSFYFPILLLTLYSLKDEIHISKYPLIISLILYLVLIFIPLVFNIGFKSYAITKSGTLGFYNSANEISGIISILTPILIGYLLNKKNVLIRVVLIIIYLVVILMIGTKTPLLALIISIGLICFWQMLKYLKKKEYKKLLSILGIAIVSLISLMLILPKTNFYKNIKTHLNYLKIDSVDDITDNAITFDHLIFSERLTFYNNKKEIYNASSLSNKLFGIGYYNNEKQTKLIEIDYYDIYYSHGIIGLILYMTIVLYIIISVVKKRKIINFDYYLTSISVLLMILLSLFTGHIMTSPSVSIIITILVLSMIYNRKKRLLFTAYSLDIGGIETSLINLLNNINYNRYSVDLVLEQKKGIFLEKVNKKVKVSELKVSDDKNIIKRKIINIYRKFMFALTNYHMYDFSCCYATYSLSSNLLARSASTNCTIYIHNNYKYVYQTENETRKFFDDRKIKEFIKIIFVSNESKEDFLQFYPKLVDKVDVINNFIDINAIKEKSLEAIKEKRPAGKVLLVYVGRLDDDAKKISRAINLVKNIKELELFIVGDGPDKNLYTEFVEKSKLEDRVKFLGKKSNPYPYIKIADYLILTSNYEGFPVTYLESIVLNTQIITTIDVSDDEINIGKDYAYIISKEEDKMIDQVRKILREKKKGKKIDLESIQKKRIKKLEKLFDEVI